MALPGAPEDKTALPDVTAKRFTGDLDEMVERRIVRVLTTHSRINYFVDRGEPRGIIYDTFKLFEDDLNRKLENRHIRVLVMIVPVAHDELIPALLSGRGDVVAAGLLLTEWRKEQVASTTATLDNISTIVVSNREAPALASPLDLGGKDVYLRMSDVSKNGVDRFNAMLKSAGKPPVNLIAAPEVLANEDILEMVNAGLVPMTIVDDYEAEFWAKVFPNLVLNPSVKVREGLSTGMLVRTNNPQLLDELNAFLARYPKGSTKRNVLLQSYLKSLKHVRNATSKAERAKFEKTVGLFRRYGERYDIDYLLMAAQGYQESRLDQDVKSPVGAIGVMQVMPATGESLKVGDIHDLDANIHAGVKYIRFMIDEQYAKEPMDDLNKVLFAFASYNAGPGRINGLRRKAAQRGLNPNLWFNNVEVLAAESIGRETVQYVSNIYKYYLAYRLILDQQERRQGAKADGRTTP